jgi:hypothetical protein
MLCKRDEEKKDVNGWKGEREWWWERRRNEEGHREG